LSRAALSLSAACRRASSCCSARGASSADMACAVWEGRGREGGGGLARHKF
jgi:hypothetical protein